MRDDRKTSSFAKLASLCAGAIAATLPSTALACPDCDVGRLARDAFLGASFGHNALLVASPVLAMAAVTTVAHRTSRTGRGSSVAAGALIGAGLGGFLDGIVLHQLLQWHNVLSSKVAPIDLVSMKVNMLWDGLFHVLTWSMTFAGVVLLFRADQRSDAPWPARSFAGSLLLGWGLFNVVEGVLDHHVLQLHHVRPGAHELAWDLGFLALGAVLIVLGWALTRPARRAGALRRASAVAAVGSK